MKTTMQNLNLITEDEKEEIRDYLNDKSNPKYKNFADDVVYILAYRLGILKSDKKDSKLSQ